MITRTVFAVAAFAALGATAQVAEAQDGDDDSSSIWNFYAGGGLGVSKIDDTACDALRGVNTDTQQDCDDKDTAYKLYVGWRPLKNFAFEGGYLDLGETDAKGGQTNIDNKVDGWTAAALVFIPGLEGLGAFNKGGAYFYDQEVKGVVGTDIFPPPGNERVDSERSDSTGYFGAGFRLPIGNNLQLSVEWERFLDVGDDDNFAAGESDYDFFSVGGVFTF